MTRHPMHPTETDGRECFFCKKHGGGDPCFFCGAQKDGPTGQLPLFDRPFDRGMDGSAQAGAKWTPLQIARVGAAIERLAKAGRPFTTDDVWREVPDVPVTKGIAARLNAAARRGIIRNTGETRISRRGGEHDHAQRLAVWIGTGAPNA